MKVGATARGKICRKRISALLQPLKRAALMKGLWRIARTWLRTRRAYFGHEMRARARMAPVRPLNCAPPDAAEHGRCHDGEDKDRESQEHVGNPHEGRIDPAAGKSGHEARYRSQYESQGHDGQGRVDGNGAAGNDARQDTAAETVRTQRIGAARREQRQVQVLQVGIMGSQGVRKGGDCEEYDGQEQEQADAAQRFRISHECRLLPMCPSPQCAGRNDDRAGLPPG